MMITSLGGVELVLSALGRHSSHVGVQEMGLSVIQNLSANGSLWVVGVSKSELMMVCRL